MRLILRVTDVPAAIFKGGSDASLSGADAAFGSGNFKAMPVLVVSVAQQNVAPGHVGNRDRRDDRLEGDVLKPFELQIHLDLPLRWESHQKERGQDEGAGHARLKYCNSSAARGRISRHDPSPSGRERFGNGSPTNHCGGAVKGGGKRFSRRFGSARTACS